MGKLTRTPRLDDELLNQGVLDVLDDVDRRIFLAMARTNVPDKQLTIYTRLEPGTLAKSVKRIAGELDI